MILVLSPVVLYGCDGTVIICFSHNLVLSSLVSYGKPQYSLSSLSLLECIVKV